jgi:hypothetical protein
VAEIINTPHLRDFRSRAIFEFFNTIRQKRPMTNVRAYAGPISPAGRLISTGEHLGDGP